jgi:predicted ATPase
MRRGRGGSVDAADRYILTGAPGTGKTAILGIVGAEIRWVAEPAREILAEQRSLGGAGTPDGDPSLFVDLLLQRSIDKHEAARHWEGPVVFDRGIPDCVAYAALLGVDPAPSMLASDTYRYNSRVLLLEPWEEIYAVDDERTMSFAATIVFQEELMRAYRRAGYALVSVPRESVEDRAAFVRDFIEHREYPPPRD